MRIDTELSVLHVGDNKLPSLTFNFKDEEGAQCVAEFEPKRVLLAEATKEHYSLVDEEGYEYARVKRSDEWTQAALELGVFVLTMRTPLPDGDRVGGRIFLVSFPFGNVIKDSGTFSVRESEVAMLEAQEKVTHRLRDSAVRMLDKLRGNHRGAN